MERSSVESPSVEAPVEVSSDWRPSIDTKNLRVRAKLLAQTREFFAQRNVLEVETPLLGLAPASDPHLHALTVDSAGQRYLQTSPEYAMKRLLAAGSGPIYQLCKAFRAAEVGSRHNTEFTMLEWYRPGFELAELQQELLDLLSQLFEPRPARSYTYRGLFLEHLGLDPHTAPLAELRQAALIHCGFEERSEDRELWLDLLMSHVIEPILGRKEYSLVYDFPASQAALAEISTDDHGNSVAKRFELYVNGMEVANAYSELRDANEQKQRFLADLKQREELQLPIPPLDQQLDGAMRSGLPQCAGIALGFDRLMMLVVGTDRLADVAFV